VWSNLNGLNNKESTREGSGLVGTLHILILSQITN